jgi:hypothetical protein
MNTRFLPQLLLRLDFDQYLTYDSDLDFDFDFDYVLGFLFSFSPLPDYLHLTAISNT